MTSQPYPAYFAANADCWINASWRTERRYYQVEIMQDLFGMWMLRRSWGGLGSQRRNSKSHAFAEYDEALKCLAEVAKKRQRRGYVRVN